MQIEPCWQIVRFVHDQHQQIFQDAAAFCPHILRFQRRLQQQGEAIHLALIHIIRFHDIPGCKVHDNNRCFPILGQCRVGKIRSGVIPALKSALDCMIINRGIHQLCKGFGIFFLAVIIKTPQTIVKDNILVSGILEKEMQILRQPQNASLRGTSFLWILVGIQHIAL